MALMKIGSKGGEFQSPETGTFPAVCVHIVDLGTQVGEYQGKPTKKRQVILQFELHGDSVNSEANGYMKDENGKLDLQKPFLVSAWVTASFNEEATLRKYMESWRGIPYTDEDIARFETEGFDWNLMLGKPCMIQMAKNAAGKVKIASVSKFQKNLPVPTPVNPLYAFTLDEFNVDVFNKIPDGIKEYIVKSPEFQAIGKQPEDTSQVPQDEAPFDDVIPF